MDAWPYPLPASAPLETLEESLEPAYVLSEQLDITYCNQAWDRFANENQGPEAAAVNVVSRNLLDFVAPDLKSFYVALFALARASRRPVGHDYECSSESAFRLYRMQIYPLQAGAGFVVQNSLRVEHPHDRVRFEPNDAVYRDSNGIIHLCANCRRAERAAESGVWDWVPAYLQSKGRIISHGVCPMCLEFYYRAPLKDRAA